VAVADSELVSLGFVSLIRPDGAVWPIEDKLGSGDKAFAAAGLTNKANTIAQPAASARNLFNVRN
jgi:hypothetical protein